MNAPARVVLVDLGRLTDVLLLAHGVWMVLVAIVAIVAALDAQEDLA